MSKLIDGVLFLFKIFQSNYGSKINKYERSLLP